MNHTGAYYYKFTERILYMNLVFFASVATLSVAIAVNIRKNKKTQEAIEQDFWTREREANSTRRKSLDDLEYIHIPVEQFPMSLLPDVPKVEDYTQIVMTLKDQPVVNFTGISNTELKLRYGAPNIDLLTQYDQNYTILVRTLQQWAQALYDAGHIDEACRMLEYAVSTGTDISSTYRLLCQIYKEQQTPEKIGHLYPIAEVLNSAMQKSIVRILQEADRSVD